jgi:hypothetical protein
MQHHDAVIGEKFATPPEVGLVEVDSVELEHAHRDDARTAQKRRDNLEKNSPTASGFSTARSFDTASCRSRRNASDIAPVISANAAKTSQPEPCQKHGRRPDQQLPRYAASS